MAHGMYTLTLGMFCDVNDKQCRKKYPRMKLKAMETCLSMQAALHIWKKRMAKGNQVHTWVKLGLEASVNMESILKDNEDEWKLSSMDVEKLWKFATQFIICNHALCVHFEREECQLFQKGTFKGHWLLHAVKLSKYINPRKTWAYSGETYMSKMKRLIFACLKGRTPLSSLRKFMDRYVLAMTLDLKGEEWKLR